MRAHGSHFLKTTRRPIESPLADTKPLGRGNRASSLAHLSVGILAAAATTMRGSGAEPAAGPASSYSWKGRKNSKVKRWDVITIGNLSRNRYWGESDAKGVRSAICTCTVIQGDGFRLAVEHGQDRSLG
jgi:hypothetical protein